MSIDPLTICYDVTPCVEQYYTYCHFLFEQRAWAFMHFYNSFIMMIFTHDPYVTFSVVAFFALIEEGSMALATWTGMPWIKMKSEWDQADTAFDLMTSIVGTTAAILFLWVIRSPKLVRSPYLQLGLMKNEYNLEYSGKSFEEITRFSQKEYAFVKWKYLVELLAMQLLPCRVFYFITSEQDGGPLIGGFVRIDIALYFFFNTLFIILCMMVNNVTEIERTIFWKGDTKRYYRFHALWFLVNVLLLSPSVIYLFDYPKITMLVGATAVYIIFIPTAIFVTIYERNIPPLSFKFFF